MTDIVIAPKDLDARMGGRWSVRVFHPRPLRTLEGDSLYVVHGGRLAFVSTIVLVANGRRVSWIHLEPARSVTLPCQCRSFEGFRYRWWDLSAEMHPPDCTLTG